MSQRSRAATNRGSTETRKRNEKIWEEMGILRDS